MDWVGYIMNAPVIYSGGLKIGHDRMKLPIVTWIWSSGVLSSCVCPVEVISCPL